MIFLKHRLDESHHSNLLKNLYWLLQSKVEILWDGLQCHLNLILTLLALLVHGTLCFDCTGILVIPEMYCIPCFGSAVFKCTTSPYLWALYSIFRAQANATYLVQLSLMLPPHNPCLPPLELNASSWSLSYFSPYLIFAFNNHAWNFSFGGPSLSLPIVNPWKQRAGFIYFCIQSYQTPSAKDLKQYFLYNKWLIKCLLNWSRIWEQLDFYPWPNSSLKNYNFY